jgi:hypothetical protein
MKIKKFFAFGGVSMIVGGVGMIVGLYATLVLTVLWGWFVVPAFHLSPISFWVMYGLTMLISLLRPTGTDINAKNRHKIVAVMLDACVPSDRREEVTEQLKELKEQVWYQAGWQVFEQVVAISVTLGIGFVVHRFAS